MFGGNGFRVRPLPHSSSGWGWGGCLQDSPSRSGGRAQPVTGWLHRCGEGGPRQALCATSAQAGPLERVWRCQPEKRSLGKGEGVKVQLQGLGHQGNPSPLHQCGLSTPPGPRREEAKPTLVLLGSRRGGLTAAVVEDLPRSLMGHNGTGARP